MANLCRFQVKQLEFLKKMLKHNFIKLNTVDSFALLTLTSSTSTPAHKHKHLCKELCNAECETM